MRIAGIFGIVVLGCVISSNTAAQSGFCGEAFEKKLAFFQTYLDRIDGAVPAVPQSSSDYFTSEYNAAVFSGAPGRTRLVESQPFFREWKLRRQIQSVRQSMYILKQAEPGSQYIFDFKSISRNRVLWATHILNQLPSLASEVNEYVSVQRGSSHPTLSSENMALLPVDAMSMSMPLDQIIECEVRKLPDPPNDRSLRTVTN